jgi:hypothetical protein
MTVSVCSFGCHRGESNPHTLSGAASRTAVYSSSTTMASWTRVPTEGFELSLGAFWARCLCQVGLRRREVRCERIELSSACASGRCPHQRASTAGMVWAAGIEPAISRSRTERSCQAEPRPGVHVIVGHLRIERSAGSLSESPGRPARHDPWCRRGESNSHCAGFEAAASACWATPAYGPRQVSSPEARSACSFRRRDSNPRLSASKARVLAAGPLRIVVAADGVEPSRAGLWGPSSPGDRSGSPFCIRPERCPGIAPGSSSWRPEILLLNQHRALHRSEPPEGVAPDTRPGHAGAPAPGGRRKRAAKGPVPSPLRTTRASRPRSLRRSGSSRARPSRRARRSRTRRRRSHRRSARPRARRLASSRTAAGR